MYLSELEIHLKISKALPYFCAKLQMGREVAHIGHVRTIMTQPKFSLVAFIELET